MKLLKLLTLIILFFCANSFSQKIIKHKIKSGESIYGLALKYDVNEKEIYALNPKSKGSLLHLGDVVKIPNKKFKVEEPKAKKEKKELALVENNKITIEKNTDFITHIVAAKETIYSISKKYSISMETVCELNPELKTGNLKTGTKLKVPNTNKDNATIKIEDKKEVSKAVLDETQSVATTDNSVLIHKVLPKESLFRISKKYGVSVTDLKKLNPDVTSELPIGYDLVVKNENKNKSIEKAVIKLSEPAKEVVDFKPLSIENTSKAEFLIAKATENLGSRYRSGGTSSAGFDCSGLMCNTFKSIDLILPRTSHDMANFGVKIDKENAQKGDLIFFATFGGKRVSHVGMVTEVTPDGEIKFIHSASSSGVIVSSIKENYYTKTFVQINRVLLD
jgi:cell wall-associated NlpC family hydrolase